MATCKRPAGTPRGRKQYRYHARFREIRESTKYQRMLTFAETLPVIRAKVQRHLALRSLSREKVLATVVHLLEATLIRVGCDEYPRHCSSQPRRAGEHSTRVSIPCGLWSCSQAR